LESVSNNYFRICVAFLLVAATLPLNAQKVFDCSIDLKERLQNQKMLGHLTAVSDSSVTIRISNGENIIMWKDIRRIRFRKHNGFSRTALPIILGESAAIEAAFQIRNASMHPHHLSQLAG